MATRTFARAAAQSGRTQTQDEGRFDKTRICKFYLKRRCTRGSMCTFAHGTEDVKTMPDLYKTQICYAFNRAGGCKEGSSCTFAHSHLELRSNERPAHTARWDKRQAPLPDDEATFAPKGTLNDGLCDFRDTPDQVGIGTYFSGMQTSQKTQPYLGHSSIQSFHKEYDAGQLGGSPRFVNQMPQLRESGLFAEEFQLNTWESLPAPAKIWVDSSPSVAPSYEDWTQDSLPAPAKIWFGSSSSTAASDEDMSLEPTSVYIPQCKGTEEDESNDGDEDVFSF